MLPAAALATGGTAAVLLAANGANAVLSVYYTAAPLSLWGLLVFSVAGLLVMCAALVACLAWRHADWRAFAIADAPEQRALLRRHRGRLTLGQTMVLVSLANWFAAVTQWYATPPDRTPPNCGFVLHGHTHVPRDETDARGVRWLNPGCITRPNRGAPPSFAWLVVEPNQAPTWKLELI